MALGTPTSPQLLPDVIGNLGFEGGLKFCIIFSNYV